MGQRRKEKSRLMDCRLSKATIARGTMGGLESAPLVSDNIDAKG